MTALQLERARPEDAARVIELLERNHLPSDGLAEHLGHAIVAKSDGLIVGSAAIERYADGGLLRSVAVAPELQGRGIGHQLTEAALTLAGELRLPALYLLTTTADRFFPQFGFARITRDDVPESVRASVEFTSACPASAVVMRRRLL